MKNKSNNESKKGLIDIFPRLYVLCYHIYLFIKLVLLNILIRPFLRRPQYKKQYKIAICGIFKNEANFLKEWIEYHEMIIKVLINTVDRLLGRPEGADMDLITYVTDRAGHDLRYAIDSTKLQNELG